MLCVHIKVGMSIASKIVGFFRTETAYYRTSLVFFEGEEVNTKQHDKGVPDSVTSVCVCVCVCVCVYTCVCNLVLYIFTMTTP